MDTRIVGYFIFDEYRDIRFEYETETEMNLAFDHVVVDSFFTAMQDGSKFDQSWIKKGQVREWHIDGDWEDIDEPYGTDDDYDFEPTFDPIEDERSFYAKKRY
jgi:hypothetical protein